ncbi:MAG: GMC family oxidoreductase [Gammaproteobacteria bacterium]
MDEHFDVIIVGTGFAGSFFLMRYLQHAPGTARVLVLDRGRDDSKAWQIANRKTSSINADEVFVNTTPGRKMWLTSPGFGGNSRCWWAGTMRMMPNDFRMRSQYGVGDDWPLTYDDLAPHYEIIEDVMQVAGPPDLPMRRSKPYPLPPHRFSTPDELLKKAFPTTWFQTATARASAPTGTRGVCCATGICNLCPVDARFTVQNGLAYLYKDPRVTLRLESPVEHVDVAGGAVTGVTYLSAGRETSATADTVVLAASALFNPHIMLRSGMTHKMLGKRLHEQYALTVYLDLGGVKAYNGSTVITSNGYNFYDGEHRREYAGCMIEGWTTPFPYHPGALRSEQGRWNERTVVRFLFDDLPQDINTVTVNAVNPRLADATFHDYSQYAYRGAKRIPTMVDQLSSALPIERIVRIEEASTSGHIQGTVVMGQDPANSVVDGFLVHHQHRNLLVLGASAFPTSTPILPTLTLSALSLRAADHYLARGVRPE